MTAIFSLMVLLLLFPLLLYVVSLEVTGFGHLRNMLNTTLSLREYLYLTTNIMKL
jgi:hypothetical protein